MAEPTDDDKPEPVVVVRSPKYRAVRVAKALGGRATRKTRTPASQIAELLQYETAFQALSALLGTAVVETVIPRASAAVLADSDTQMGHENLLRSVMAALGPDGTGHVAAIEEAARWTTGEAFGAMVPQLMERLRMQEHFVATEAIAVVIPVLEAYRSGHRGNRRYAEGRPVGVADSAAAVAARQNPDHGIAHIIANPRAEAVIRERVVEDLKKAGVIVTLETLDPYVQEQAGRPLRGRPKRK